MISLKIEKYLIKYNSTMILLNFTNENLLGIITNFDKTHIII